MYFKICDGDGFTPVGVGPRMPELQHDFSSTSKARGTSDLGDGVGAAAGFEDFCNDGFLIAPTADFVCDSNFPVIRPMFPY
jgi:hypothetical protein